MKLQCCLIASLIAASMAGCSGDDYGNFTQTQICKALLASEYPNVTINEMMAREEYGSVFIRYNGDEKQPDYHHECYASSGRVFYMFGRMENFIMSREFYYDATSVEDLLEITILDEYGRYHFTEFNLDDF